MIPFQQAQTTIDRITEAPPPRTELRATGEARGATLAAPAVSRLALPPFERSLMDGYAIAEPALSGPFRLATVVAAGQPAPSPLGPRCAVKVMTGAPVPAGADRVIRVERALVSGDEVRFTSDEATSNIVRQGEYAAEGQTILPAGTRLGAVELGCLVACGVTQVEVFQPLRVAVLSTGDELVQPVSQPSAAGIPDSNGPMLAALCRENGLTIVQQGCIPDDRDALRQAFQIALRRCDLVVVSGGMSAGDFDFVPEVVSALGLHLHFSRIAAKPGKPTLFASRISPLGELQLVFGLPGNPVGAFLMFQLLVLRAIRRWTGAGAPLPSIALPLATAFSRGDSERLELVLCRITPEGKVEPQPCRGSGDLLGLQPATACFEFPPGIAQLAPGAMVNTRPFPRSGLY